MVDKIGQIEKAILEITQAKLTDFEQSVQKYGLVIGVNQVMTVELVHSLNEVFGIDISLEELNDLTPIICKNLNLKFEALKAIDNLDSVKPAAYSITLYD